MVVHSTEYIEGIEVEVVVFASLYNFLFVPVRFGVLKEVSSTAGSRDA